MKNTESMADLKKEAALQAASLVESGQTVGLGTGSTAAFAVRELGRRVREEGLSIRCVGTSHQTLLLARESGLVLDPVSFHDRLDISIDGADEIDPHLNLIKGGGGAQTLEKIVHAMSDRFIVVADESKLVEKLGTKFAIPVEVLGHAIAFVERRLLALGAREVILRSGSGKDGPVITDNGNMLMDARFEITDPAELESRINEIPGVVENGVFSTRTLAIESAIVAGAGGVRILERGDGRS